ncbi:MAG TPA: alpha/beta hydrolase [Kribbella sp.]|uniref:alpha/beta fold hydrolase n=1 Tax=Kribbella sp. TaxID=1871183 RepID=UPI002D76B02A|nr:alpha/beta hydrolase [Kribbella sp.]HET6293305.1 alpha/beta hydrolase [Kribbella sp.]
MAATMVDVGGYKLAAEISGEGSPTVVFISGTADAGAPWDAAIAAHRSSTTLVTYARAGIGESEMPADSKPRSVGAAEEELRGLLASAGVGRPAVLVGHSFGALIGLYFAATWPQDLAGLVMVDSTDIHLNLDIEKPWTVIPDSDEDGGISFDMLASAEEVERSTGPLAVPSVVITSRVGRWLEIESVEHWLPFTREALEERWQRNQAALAAELGVVHKIARFGDHYVQIDDPTIVAEAIDDLIDAARQA